MYKKTIAFITSSQVSSSCDGAHEPYHHLRKSRYEMNLKMGQKMNHYWKKAQGRIWL